MHWIQKNISVLCALLFIISVGLIGCWALLHPGFYTSHDGEHQLVRQYVFDQGLRDGQIPVRVNRQLYNGYGYPLFVFTYRLPFYIGEVFRLFGASYAESVKTTFILTYLASGVSMFLFARRWGVLSGLIASIFYLWAPYRFAAIFVRASLGEHVALAFIPLLFWSLSGVRLYRLKVIVGAISVAGLLLSHAMVTQIVFLFIPFWIIAQMFSSKQHWNFIKQSFVIFLLGFALSTYYVVPAFYYKQFTQKLNPFYFSDHFVTFRQLLYSPWGYAFSMKGTDNDGMSFQVGLAQWAAIGLAALVLARQRKLFSDGVALLIIFSVSIFLMMESSSFIWERWRSVINIDIPWRFLSISTFSSAAVAGWANGQIDRRAIRLGMIAVLIGLLVYANRNYRRVNEYLEYPDEKLQTYTGTSNSDNEYRPVWDDRNIAGVAHEGVVISKGVGDMRLIERRSHLIRFAVKANDAIRLDINTLFFPGWAVFIDGQKAPFKYAGEGGIMRVDVPSGYHLIEARYRETILMIIADMITVVSMGGVIVWSRKTG